MKKKNAIKHFMNFLSFFSRIIPKKENKIIFDSKPDFSDNSRFLFEYLQKKYAFKFDMVWIVYDKKIREYLLNKGIEAVYAFSFRGLKEILTAKIIISSHTHFIDMKSKNQIYVDLWHGMPLKRILFLDPNDPTNLKHLRKETPKIDILISTSSLMKSVLSGCFHMYSKNVFITGQPRCDGLFKEPNRKTFEKILELNLSSYEKIIFYLPTYREGYEKKIDGLKMEDNIFRFPRFNWQEFSNFLEKTRTLFVCKLHPFEEKIYESKIKELNSPYFKLLTSRSLVTNFTDLYNIIGIADMLITDYSSIYFDFLLLNRPMIFIPTDLEDYRKSRGFTIEPYDFWTPGPKVTNQNDLQKEIRKCWGDPSYYADKRKIVNDIINYYKDGNSSERVWKQIENILKTKKHGG